MKPREAMSFTRRDETTRSDRVLRSSESEACKPFTRRDAMLEEVG